ncbi:type VI secretion system protein ImpB [Geoalkalibacter ferrihydriticus]|uniref:Type VI secretion protein n=2 Tax=Geoalkalibacter ferrihydriticus TaxID=392333 RepID=A0A0C2HNL2_9BACT|nr:type VI secretion system contractile sheath small subunit [Geoalkalibacter ferrihydriticus]KIH76530.1 type VI secretion protein [Geoalkalibacter ferrihydriticus DSM 17813]SDL99996.1 type VI secretion system protein ImpB [Geoalkalibacter ferrihydriticus]
MADSFQKEIPKARVNIALDVETGGNRKKVELPLKMLVVGDFTNGKTTGRVAERERTNINKNNFEAVLRNMAPEARFAVPNELTRDGEEIAVNLKFDSMKSFHPDRVANQIPEMHSMMAMRNLLKDLKANLLDNAGFRKELEKIVKDQPELAALKGQLEEILGPVPAAGGE